MYESVLISKFHFVSTRYFPLLIILVLFWILFLHRSSFLISSEPQASFFPAAASLEAKLTFSLLLLSLFLSVVSFPSSPFLCFLSLSLPLDIFLPETFTYMI